MQCTRYAAVHHNRAKGLHVTSIRRYPDPPTLPLPMNVSQIFANETARFTPERSRDIAAPVFLYNQRNECKSFSEQSSNSMDRSNIPATCSDTHVDSYDCFGAVSLNGTMQSNVPKPFCSSGKSTHLNMPGGQWARDGKYIAEDMQKSHYRSVQLPPWKLDVGGSPMSTLLRNVYWPNYTISMGYSTNVSQQLKDSRNTPNKQCTVPNLTKKERFKRIVKDYGITITVFHIGISLISLGACYAAVVSGIDFTSVIETLVKEEYRQKYQNILTTSSTFLVAYTIHKMFAFVRISITLAVAPLVVKRLRQLGILKAPKIKTTERS
ncbi:uncharacterized protein LOC143177938 isoform X2 [Calliopsis andreniformis]